ncbi:MAG: hypothetical protein ACNA8J_10575, partial [Gammaproteobacteria bacterium]
LEGQSPDAQQNQEMEHQVRGSLGRLLSPVKNGGITLELLRRTIDDLERTLLSWRGFYCFRKSCIVR